MDKYEYKLKLDQLKSLVEAGDYETAADIADDINWKKVRNINTLGMVGTIYEETAQYEKCRNVLLQAYEHSTIGRNIVRRLTEVAVKARRVEEAEEYYNEFIEIAPNDNNRYILAYQISCLKNAPITDRIAILEGLKEQEYTEKWAYELAVLYSRANMTGNCVEACDELVLWFGDGEYVEKALDLKRRYQPLTPSQETKYQQLSQNKTVELNIPDKKDAVTASTFNAEGLQEELAKSIAEIFNATENETVTENMDKINKMVSDIPYLEQAVSQDTKIYTQDMLNEERDQALSESYQETEIPVVSEEDKAQQVDGQMSIEDILADWEKTKMAAEAAIAAAEQKKLERSKEQALSEAGDIMERLKTLIPLISATPGEDNIPEDIPAAADTIVAVDGNAPAATKAVVEPAVLRTEVGDGGMANAIDAMAATEAEDAMLPTIDITPDLFDDMPAEEAPAAPVEAATEIPAAPVETPIAAEAAVEPAVLGTEVGDGGMANANTAMEETDPEEAMLASLLAEAMTETAPEAPVAAPVAEAPAQPEEEILPEIQMPEDLVDEIPAPQPQQPINGLTPEQKELFSYFLPVLGMEEQIYQVIANAANKQRTASVTSLTGNIIIQGEEGSGRTILAKNLVKAIQQTQGKADAKIGKISAESLNNRDFAALVPKIAGGYLIIEEAGLLEARTVARMSQIMEQNTRGMTIILEDTGAGIKQVMSLDYGFAKKFTDKIKIPVYTIDELVKFGKSYAAEMECSIDEMGVLAMYNRISNIQKVDRGTTLAEVKEIVDRAIENAEGGGIKKMFAKKYNDNDYLILREEDFEM